MVAAAERDDKGAGENPSGSSPENKSPGPAPGAGDTDHQAGDEPAPGAIPYYRYAAHREQYRALTEENEAEKKARLAAEEERDRYKAILDTQGEFDENNLDPSITQKVEIQKANRRTTELEAKMEANEKARNSTEVFEARRRAFEAAVDSRPELAGNEERRALVEQAFYFNVLADLKVEPETFVEESAQLFANEVKPSPTDKLRGTPDTKPVKTKGRDDDEDKELKRVPHHVRLRKMMARAKRKASDRMSAQDKRTEGM